MSAACLGAIVAEELDGLESETVEYMVSAIIGEGADGGAELLVDDRDDLLDLVSPLLLDAGVANDERGAKAAAGALWARLVKAAAGRAPDGAAAARAVQELWRAAPEAQPQPAKGDSAEFASDEERREALGLTADASEVECAGEERWRDFVGLPRRATVEQCAAAHARRSTLLLDGHASEAACAEAESWRGAVGLPLQATAAQCLQAKARRELLRLNMAASPGECAAAEAALLEASDVAAARWRVDVGLGPDATTAECEAVLAKDAHAVFSKAPGAARYMLELALAKHSWVNTKGPGKGMRAEGRKGIAAIAEFSGGVIVLVTSKVSLHLPAPSGAKKARRPFDRSRLGSLFHFFREYGAG